MIARSLKLKSRRCGRSWRTRSSIRRSWLNRFRNRNSSWLYRKRRNRPRWRKNLRRGHH